MELRKKTSQNESLKISSKEVSVTALMTRVTQSMSLTVDTSALATLHPSVEAIIIRTTLRYTQFMAQGGETHFQFPPSMI